MIHEVDADASELMDLQPNIGETLRFRTRTASSGGSKSIYLREEWICTATSSAPQAQRKKVSALPE